MGIVGEVLSIVRYLWVSMRVHLKVKKALLAVMREGGGGETYINGLGNASRFDLELLFDDWLRLFSRSKWTGEKLVG